MVLFLVPFLGVLRAYNNIIHNTLLCRACTSLRCGFNATVTDYPVSPASRTSLVSYTCARSRYGFRFSSRNLVSESLTTSVFGIRGIYGRTRSDILRRYCRARSLFCFRKIVTTTCRHVKHITFFSLQTSVDDHYTTCFVFVRCQGV